MNSPKVAIIIVTWNGVADTVECLDSLLKINYSNFGIFLVDNNSTDKTLSVIQNRFPSVSLISNKKNEGFAPAVNKGILAALHDNYENILLLNNDTIVEENFLTALVKSLNSNNTVGIVGSKIYYFNSNKMLWFAGGKFDLNNGFFHNISQLEIDNEFSVEKPVDYVSGCSMLFKTEILSKTSLLNELYGSYVEDVEFNLKARDNGYDVLIVPSSIVWHKVSRSTGGEGNKRKTFLIVRNTIFFTRTYLKKKFGLISYFYLGKFIIFQTLLSLKQKRYSSTIAIFKALLPGFTSRI